MKSINKILSVALTIGFVAGGAVADAQTRRHGPYIHISGPKLDKEGYRKFIVGVTKINSTLDLLGEPICRTLNDHNEKLEYQILIEREITIENADSTIEKSYITHEAILIFTFEDGILSVKDKKSNIHDGRANNIIYAC